MQSWAQREFIQGKLLDSATNEPVVFATIRLKGRAIGVISNQDGGFRIPKDFQEKGDSLIISSLGYKTKQVSILKFLSDSLNLIKLSSSVIELDEVFLEGERGKRRNFGAKRIVRNAIKAIPKNYPVSPFSTIGYYRDYQFSDGEYMNLNEAILEVFDLGFDELDELNSKVRIYDKKQNTDFKRDTVADNKYGETEFSKKLINNATLLDYGGNEFTILRVHNAIRNYQINTYDFVNRFETDFLRNHFFRKQKDTYTEEEALYTIRVSKALPGYFVQGLLYISKRDFAIHKMQYSVYENSEFYLKRVNEEEDRQLFFEIVTEYRRGQDQKMYLNYISFHNDFWTVEPPEFDISAIVLVPDCQCFEVRFTKAIDSESAVDKNNYPWSYKGKKIEFSEIIVFDNAVRLFPKISSDTFKNMAYALSNRGRNPKKPSKLFKTEILNVRDRDLKHDLGENRLRKFQQFREFFVQRVSVGKEASTTGPYYMNKNHPIFEDQPVSRPIDFDDYWMNTPLKKTEK